MEVDDAAILLQKIFGPVLLVLCPIMLAIVIFGGMHAVGTPEELSLKQWILGVLFFLGGFSLGAYICRIQFGWFSKDKRNGR